MSRLDVYLNRRSLRCCGGFTLIETLVAMVILSISLVVILQLFSSGLKSSRLSDNYTRAIFHAREKMEEILLDDNFTDMAMEGEFSDDFEWKAQTLRLEPAQEEEAKLPFDIFSIKVDVSWHEGSKEKHFEISTLKIGEKEKLKIED
jgi:general secretion pathway protein I